MKKIRTSPHIEALQPYLSARRIGGSGEVWLNANELPFAGAPCSLDGSQYHRYPDQGPEQLHAAYGQYLGIGAGQVLALRGADEAIDLLLRAYCQAGMDGIVVSGPTYGMYRVCAELQNAAVVDVPLTEDYQLDVDAITAQQQAKIVFVCNPNNPTGNAFRRQDILRIVRHFEGRAIVAIDEAYIEFCPQYSLVSELRQFANLVVIRTMSKAFGLAGVRVGFLLAGEPVMAIMRKVAAPYPLPDPCAQIALQALAPTALDLLQQQVATIGRIRQDFCDAIKGFSAVRYLLPSVTNFVLVGFADRDHVWQALTRAGIVARQIPHPRLHDAIRFSIGTAAEMQQVTSVLASLA